MRKTIVKMAIVAALVAALPAAAADVKVELRRQAQEWIGSSVIADDGSGVVALASHSPRSSRLVSFTPAGAATEVRVPGIAVNAIQPLGSDRYFLSGAAEGHYAARVVQVSNGEVITLWDSSSLGESVTRNENAVVRVEASGTEWAALVPATGGRFSVLFGSVSDPASVTKHHFESAASFQGTPARGFSGGSYDMAMLGGPRGDAHVAVLLPTGSVYVVSPKSGVKAILTSSLGGGQLLWEPSAETLWVESGNAWSSFPVGKTILATKPAAAKPAMQRPVLVTKFEKRTGRPVAAFPLSGNSFALRTNDNGRAAIEIFTTADTSPRVVGLSDLPPAGIVKISPSARYLLTLPEGPKSNAIVITSL